MKPRKFHIWQFPEDKIRILFKYHKRFIDNATKFFGSQKNLADFLGTSSIVIYYWRKHPLYIPLKHVKKIVKKCKLDWYKIEKGIVSYKGINTSSPIINPKLPIKETPEIFALITHIICDGSVNKKGIPYYINSNKNLIDNLDKILKNNFGDINTKLEFGRGINKNCYEYKFPKIIVELLEYFYKINLYKADKLPVQLFYLPKKFCISVIRAFVDDEGDIDLSKRIGIYSTNKHLLKTLIRLLKEKLNFKNIGEIKEKEKGYYYFYINSKDIKRYNKEIGSFHSSKKKRLNELIKLKKNGCKIGQHSKVGETKEKLLKLLNDKILSTYEIMKELKINKSNVNTQIRKLRKSNLIVQDYKIGQIIFWTRKK